MNASMPPVWSAPRFPDFEFRHWQGATFVFDPASGRTHYLNEAAAEILMRLAEAPGSTDSLLEAMLGDHPSDDPAAFLDAGRRVLVLLDQLGLIVETGTPA